MDFEFSDIQTMLIDSAARFLKDRSGVEYWRERRHLPDGCDRKVWAEMADLGWLALAIPEDVGGIGGTTQDLALLMVELGRGLITEPVVSTAVLGAYLLDQLTEGERRERLLGAIVAGELRLALAHGEASDRYEIARVRKTTARARGDGYVIDGAKLMVFDAPCADQLLVTATLVGTEPFGLFMVAADAPGVSRDSYRLVDGGWAADVTLAGVSVPANALLASGEVAVSTLKAAGARADVALVAQAVGVMDAAVETTSEYAKERRQFGQPIGKFQAVQHLAADMFVAAFEARSALYQQLAHQGRAEDEVARANAIARVIVADRGKTVGHNGIQIHGGYGMTDEYAIGHYWRRLYSLERQYGDATHFRECLAAMGCSDEAERQGIQIPA